MLTGSADLDALARGAPTLASFGDGALEAARCRDAPGPLRDRAAKARTGCSRPRCIRRASGRDLAGAARFREPVGRVFDGPVPGRVSQRPASARLLARGRRGPRRRRSGARGALGLSRCDRERSASSAPTIGFAPRSRWRGSRSSTSALRDPKPLRNEDAYYVASMHLAHTPRGLRLVQVDPEFELERAERGRPLLAGFDVHGLELRRRPPQLPGLGVLHSRDRHAAGASLRLPARRPRLRGQRARLALRLRRRQSRRLRLRSPTARCALRLPASECGPPRKESA